jgi:hypothetical protein
VKPSNKFLVDLLSGFSNKQIFFLIWAAVVVFFALLMWNFYRKNTRSNFRRPSDGPAPKFPVDARRLSDSRGSAVQVKDNSPAKKR